MNDMQISLKKFTKTNARFENRISLTKSNSIGFPTNFYKDNGVKDMKYAVLYYDEDNKVIGIRFTNEKEDGVFSIAHSNQGYGGSIIVTSFLNSHKIPVKTYAHKYKWEKKSAESLGLSDSGDIFFFQLTPNSDADTEPSND